MIDIVNRTA